ncbi:nucleoside/nucleotide kinase family protein [Rhodococcus sp. H36-A4]|uniref:nucleoside/nucleotide kinase family protein n=1 Tax=Rhodococcus sp. H36-A4 TaxID=3004353 RepID=UPI0022AE6216|nr:nucleoside/nucleotide kinase family protein [Rhodococcus sp. H36-A4]MCZ4080052.1 nucleoside/nucleotide kinase family protein [Rhodococcus sp. H36-A4]
MSKHQPVYRAESFDRMLEYMAERARDSISSGERKILGITGPPGSGKSTVCKALGEVLGAKAAIVEMDGFHLSNSELNRLSMRDRKGAPDTFDVDGYVALLGRLRKQDSEVVYAPRFDRGLEESVGSAVPILRSTALIITEGNYLLSADGGWQRVRPALDEVWYLDVSQSILTERLISRQRRHGKALADARMWTERVDLPNSNIVAGAREQADLVFAVPEDPNSYRG